MIHWLDTPALVSKTLSLRSKLSQTTTKTWRPKNCQWVTSDWDWPEECLLPRLICSYQDLTLASDELGDFVVRAGAGAGSPQMAGSEGEGWDVGVRRGRWNTCAFLPCKVRCRIPVFALRRWSTAIFVEWCLSPRDRNCVGLHCLMLWGHWTTGQLVDSRWPPRNGFWEKKIGVFKHFIGIGSSFLSSSYPFSFLPFDHWNTSYLQL